MLPEVRAAPRWGAQVVQRRIIDRQRGIVTQPLPLELRTFCHKLARLIRAGSEPRCRGKWEDDKAIPFKRTVP